MNPSNSALRAFVSKMKKAGLSETVIAAFSHYYRQLAAGETGLLSDREIRAVPPSEVKDASFLNELASAGRKAFAKTVMIVLNGGLGTSMGLTGPKSLIEIKAGHSFLDIKLRQAEHEQLKIALMNSFNTHQETLSAVKQSRVSIEPHFFLQHKYPKILKDSLEPADWPQDRELEWNPPGHGDVYSALVASGLLSELIDEGVTYAFISNSDNLGATLDPALLGYFATYRFPFMMEVAERTPADLKGGHLARHQKGYLVLREIAQCPPDEIESFQDIRRYRYFNTNNIWLNLSVLRNLISIGKPIYLPIIINPKTLDPRDPGSPAVYQIETAMGAAISLFKNAAAVKVDERRFFPVKKCSDLLAIRSDCYLLDDDWRLIPNPARSYHRIKIDLDPAFYTKIDDFNARFSKGIPSLVDCRSLSVKGDVYFENHVVLKGDVVIENPKSDPAVVAEGSVIQGHYRL